MSGVAAAVLGAGLQGVAVALELASRGVTVDLYDREAQALTQAAARNEGKIHLGFVYANDATLETTRLLVRGALTFDGLLQRWLDTATPFEVSTRHHYAVHRESQRSPAEIAAHFTRVRDIVRATAEAGGGSYLGQDPRSVGFSSVEPDGSFDDRRIAAVFSTDERSVDVRALAGRLRARVAAETRIRFHPSTTVTGAARDGDAVAIDLRDPGGARRCRYRHVVNCLWDGRIAIDQAMGLPPRYSPIYRLKHGLFIDLREPRPDLLSTTFVVGQYGDIVNFGGRRVYLSWYPVARTAVSTDLVPPDWPRDIADADARRMLAATVDAFVGLVPRMCDLSGCIERCEVTPAVIVAAGRSDIDDPASQLHTRTAIGVRSTGGYHSTDPGKYTMAPYFALTVADRVCGSPR